MTIDSNVWIGGGALILPGVTVWNDAMVGAGAVVTRLVGQGRRSPATPTGPRRV